MDNVIGKNIQYYRESAKYKKTELAKLIPCDVSLITRYEKGERQPTLKILLKISEIFGISLEKLVTEQENKFQIAARGSGKQSKSEAQEFVVLKQIAEDYIELMKNVSINTEYQGLRYPNFHHLQVGEIKRNLDLNDSINYENFKTALRTKWNIQIIEIPLKTRKISGITFNLENHFIIFINKGHTEERKLFSLAHEVCHIIYHIKQTLYLISRLSSRNKIEKEANKFAEEFLIPSEILSEGFKIDELHNLKKEYITELAGKFNVSPECMFRDLNRKGLVQYNWKSYRPVTDYDENYLLEWKWSDLPYLYVVGVFYNWKLEKISLARAAKYLYSDIRTISKLFNEINDQIEKVS
ncbi:MAG: XRE family transcriptional regulator [Candidatus Cloacimonetes bacterium]|jgi:Zn-dependent peptidase ImmA (M78 family)/DNA-binding XRE family transcriptional regulator|nr:XRE family transcriptional regulator [Candidatus Cloacimonadota bacterium]